MKKRKLTTLGIILAAILVLAAGSVAAVRAAGLLQEEPPTALPVQEDEEWVSDGAIAEDYYILPQEVQVGILDEDGELILEVLPLLDMSRMSERPDLPGWVFERDEIDMQTLIDQHDPLFDLTNLNVDGEGDPDRSPNGD